MPARHTAATNWIRQHRFTLLLTTITLLMLAMPVARLFVRDLSSTSSRVLTTVVFNVMLLAAIFAVCRRRATAIAGLSLVIPAILLQTVDTAAQYEPLNVAGHVFSVAFLGLASVVILGVIFRRSRITLDTIAASLCVYLLLGILWALLYSLLETYQQDSFVITASGTDSNASIRFGAEDSSLAIYYSFVTMSTLGYGDVIPSNPLARTLAAIQAVMGQLYLAVLVARLVGLQIAQASR